MCSEANGRCERVLAAPVMRSFARRQLAMDPFTAAPLAHQAAAHLYSTVLKYLIKYIKILKFI